MYLGLLVALPPDPLALLCKMRATQASLTVCWRRLVGCCPITLVNKFLSPIVRSSPVWVNYSSVAGCLAWGGIVCLLGTTEFTTPAGGGCRSSALEGVAEFNTPADLTSWCSCVSEMAEFTTPAISSSLGGGAELLAPAHPPGCVAWLESFPTPSLLVLGICMRKGNGLLSWETTEELVGMTGAATRCLVPLFRSLPPFSPACYG